MKKVLLLSASLLSGLFLFAQSNVAQSKLTSSIDKERIKVTETTAHNSALTEVATSSTPTPPHNNNGGNGGGGNNGGITSIAGDVNQSVTLSASPNPMTDYLTLRGDGMPDGEYQVMAVDVTGKVVVNQKVTTVNHTIDCRVEVVHLPCGLYVFTIIANSYTHTFKLVK